MYMYTNKWCIRRTHLCTGEVWWRRLPHAPLTVLMMMKHTHTHTHTHKYSYRNSNRRGRWKEEEK